MENPEEPPVGCGREMGAAGGPRGPPGHLCPKTGEGGLRLDGWPPAPDRKASSGLGGTPLPGVPPSGVHGRPLGQADSQQAMSSSLQWMDGTHRLAEPVSTTTVKHCGGVPMPISP